MIRRLAWIPLAAGTALAIGAGESLRRAGQDIAQPVSPTPAILAFAGCVLLAFAAGRLTGPEPVGSLTPVRAREPISGTRALVAIACGLASLALFGVTWILQAALRGPVGAIAAWGGSVALGGAAVAAAFPERRRTERPRTTALAVPIVLVLAVAAWARLVALDAVPPGFGGDEANQIQDALGLLDGTTPGDPFGSGWYGTMRLGMLPAGLGALALSNPVAGPRVPYAIAGTLAVVGAAAAAGLLAGEWAALGAAALLAAAPHHLHFSRLASVMVLDTLAATLFLLEVIRIRRTSAPRHGYVAGAVAGLALYGYSAGRLLPLLLIAASPFLLGSDSARGRRAALAAALAAGFVIAAAPNLRFAATNFADWNSRFNQVGIFRASWWDPEVARLGSVRRVLEQQFLAGTIGLLSRHTDSTWFTGYPIVGPSVLPALGAAGLGWLFGRRRYLAAAMLGLLVAGNVAAVALTDTAPSPQRLSSMVPALAILGGIAFSAFVAMLSGPRPATRRLVGGALAAGLLVAAIPGVPPWWDPSPGYGGEDAAFALAASRALDAPRFRDASFWFDGAPFIDSGFPSFHYFLPRARFINRDPSKDGDTGPPPGLHLLPPEWGAIVRRWRGRLGLRAAALADPRDPRRDIGWLVRAP